LTDSIRLSFHLGLFLSRLSLLTCLPLWGDIPECPPVLFLVFLFLFVFAFDIYAIPYFGFVVFWVADILLLSFFVIFFIVAIPLAISYRLFVVFAISWAIS
jgi:hypothetical protein